jgi:serine/threonine protein kinase
MTPVEVSDFGDYELLEEIARGGMGVVYKARHKQLNRIAAVKVVLAGRFSSSDDIQRFHVEAAAAAQLDHSGIVPIYEIGNHEGQPFFAMKFVEGGSLAEHRDRIAENPRKMVEFMIKVSRAVHHAHQRGILHRDIKPANVLLDEDDNPLLTDLGLAKSTSSDTHLTQTGAVIGTPSYMPPEQAQGGKSLTTAGDVYSLGAILYELLTGRPPHQGESAAEIVMHVLQAPVDLPRNVVSDVDRDLELICMKCLEREPESRYASAAELATDLQHWLDGEAISVRAPSWLSLASQWLRRNQGIGYAVLALLAGFAFSVPILLSILGTLDDPAALYLNTAEDPRPLLYSFTNIPTWVSIGSSLSFLMLWPMFGLLVTLVTRPTNWRAAAFNGTVVGATCAILFALVLGWVVFMLAAEATSTSTIRLLAQNLWPPGNQTSGEVESKLLEEFPRLQNMAIEERAGYLSNRVFADAIAKGPQIWFAVALVAFILGAPIALGTIVAQVLMSRGQRWWVLVPRYILAWIMLAGSATMIPAALGGGKFNGSDFSELALPKQLLLLFGFPLFAYLVLRRWKKADRLDKGRI